MSNVGELLNMFRQTYTGLKIVAVFDLNDDLMIKAAPIGTPKNAKLYDPYFFINKNTKKIKGMDPVKDMDRIERAYIENKRINIQNEE